MSLFYTVRMIRFLKLYRWKVCFMNCAQPSSYIKKLALWMIIFYSCKNKYIYKKTLMKTTWASKPLSIYQFSIYYPNKDSCLASCVNHFRLARQLSLAMRNSWDPYNLYIVEWDNFGGRHCIWIFFRMTKITCKYMWTGQAWV